MITYLTQPGSPVVEIGVAGDVTNHDLEGWLTHLQVDLEQNGKSRILEIIEHISGFELAAIWTDLKLGLPVTRKAERIAVVAKPGWIRALAKMCILFARAEVRSFRPDEVDDARAWLVAA